MLLRRVLRFISVAAVVAGGHQSVECPVCPRSAGSVGLELATTIKQRDFARKEATDLKAQLEVYNSFDRRDADLTPQTPHAAEQRATELERLLRSRDVEVSLLRSRVAKLVEVEGKLAECWRSLSVAGTAAALMPQLEAREAECEPPLAAAGRYGVAERSAADKRERTAHAEARAEHDVAALQEQIIELNATARVACDRLAATEADLHVLQGQLDAANVRATTNEKKVIVFRQEKAKLQHELDSAPLHSRVAELQSEKADMQQRLNEASSTAWAAGKNELIAQDVAVLQRSREDTSKRLKGVEASVNIAQQKQARFTLEMDSLQQRLDDIRSTEMAAFIEYRVTATQGLIVRADIELTSIEKTKYPAGMIFQALGRKRNQQGLARVRTRDGWVSLKDAIDETPLVEELGQAEAESKLQWEIARVRREFDQQRDSLLAAEARAAQLEQERDDLDRQRARAAGVSEEARSRAERQELELQMERLRLQARRAARQEAEREGLQEQLALAKTTAREEAGRAAVLENELADLADRFEQALSANAVLQALGASPLECNALGSVLASVAARHPQSIEAPAYAEYEVVALNGLVVREGLERNDNQIVNWPRNSRFSAYETRLNSEGVTKLRVSETENHWVSERSAIDNSSLVRIRA